MTLDCFFTCSLPSCTIQITLVALFAKHRNILFFTSTLPSHIIRTRLLDLFPKHKKPFTKLLYSFQMSNLYIHTHKEMHIIKLAWMKVYSSTKDMQWTSPKLFANKYQHWNITQPNLLATMVLAHHLVMTIVMLLLSLHLVYISWGKLIADKQTIVFM